MTTEIEIHVRNASMDGVKNASGLSSRLTIFETEKGMQACFP